MCKDLFKIIYSLVKAHKTVIVECNFDIQDKLILLFSAANCYECTVFLMFFGFYMLQTLNMWKLYITELDVPLCIRTVSYTHLFLDIFVRFNCKLISNSGRKMFLG